MATQNDVADETPPQINPYEVLGIEKSASEDEIKRAYRKCALKHHPDKAPAHLKSDSHTKFQEIAFAYAILSNPNRRKRYDRTGSTSESVDADGFSWTDFYSEQYRDIVTADAINEFSSIYKGSVEEKDDLLTAYTVHEGRWGKMYQVIMLSDPIQDEERFRGIIEEAIKKGEVEEYAVFRQETKASKAKRMRKAREEEKEAAKAANQLGADKLLKGSSGNGAEKSKKSKKQVPDHMDDLAAIIQARQASRGSFLDVLEAKYASGGKKSANDPSGLDEEEFQRIQNGLGSSKSNGKAKGKGKKRGVDSEDDVEADKIPTPKKKSSRGKKREPVVEEEVENEDEDIEMDDGGNDYQAEEAEEEEEEEIEVEVEKPAPKKRAMKPATRQSKRSRTTRA
ncbi:44a80df6-aa7b-4d54-bbeb-ba56f768516a [Sclerotinia trifoliorum]|uniref:44a80df6-aa7b-4d54-bbeb-ba56f768516a n=1 Tax=Sclerotinia trifoliorum TaxID=28548 RepID=A0A8H2ZN52_9HELO|nr:44a80df6-aa7b-4d54-bbeb-ba56f768516a [Sclerotinia trifoliorum]